MKIALYGMPCAGKSTLMDRITDAKVINGSQELRRICGGSFLELSEEEKHQVRIKYTEYINGLNDEVIVSDGHYSFMETVAFTEADGELYDIFIYLYCSPENLKERYALSEKNGKFAGESIESLRQWQEFEINNLREECHRRNKDFYVVSDNEEEQNKFFDFLSLLREGFSSYDLATDICNQIMEQFNKQDILYMVDGDKTIIIQDSYRFCCNGKTKIFDGDFYTGYQSFLFEKELQTASIDKSKIAEITINNEVYDIVASNNYVVLSSGIKDLWSDIANAKNLGTIFASPYISADVKYYVVKQLREHGYTIFAYGDSKIDLYMLREADKGFLYIGKRISRSLKNESLSGLVPIYDHSLVILADEDEEVQADIAICKSNSGISGSRLAAAHVRLGEKIGRHIAAVFPEKNTSILVLERGGRFFGDGVYMGAGGIFYSMNPKQDDAPVINTERGIGGLIRYVRGALLDALSMDYVRTARAKGLKEKTVIYKHAFRNAMIPITGWIVGSIVGIFGGAVIIETLFSWKGVGKLLIDSLNQHDYTVALSMQMFYILLGLAANLITDLCYCIVDPRIKLD